MGENHGPTNDGAARMAKKIMVVDDSSFARNLIRRALADSELELSAQAADGLAALEIYKEEKFNFDLITMDLTLPKLDGLSCIAQLRALNPAAQIIVVSAISDQATKDKALALGALAFVEKPFRADQLRALVQEILNLPAP